MAADPETLFLDQLHTIDHAISYVSRRGSLRDQDAEDFASWVKLRLIEDDYAVIRKHDRRSSFAAYIAVVVQRLLLDYRIAQWGKWHASAEAKRLGECAVAIEAMLHRDGRTLEETLPALRRRWPNLTGEVVKEIASALPQRARRPRAVDLEFAADRVGVDGSSVHDAAFESERVELSRTIAGVVRSTMQEMDELDLIIFRLRFEGGMSIAAISRVLRLDQKPLYRRLQRTLARLRGRLELAGIAAEDANELLARRTDFDFGFDMQWTGTGPWHGERENS